MNIGIIGCGLIGTKRSQNTGAHKVTCVADLDRARAEKLAAALPGAAVVADWREVVKHRNVDAVIVATTHDQLARVAVAALEAGKHVLVEKPGARNAEELRPVLAMARQTGLTVRVGFNHRFHPSLLKCREIIDSGVAGPLMFIRGRYGHGGRIGYEKEWRAVEKISGGGEAIDQGVHLVDLSRWFLGDFKSADGYAPTFFWDMPVEDNAFMLLKTPKGQAAWLHASWSEWKNMFSLEIYGRTGKLQVDGLGGSYGVEKLTYYQMLPQMGPPETKTWEFPGADSSWAAEFMDFAGAVEGKQGVGATLEDAVAALDVVQQIRRR
jgi:predicted dehydrogenase